MEKSVSDALVLSLKKMISYCKNMHELLINDTKHFSKNALDHVDTSNAKKAELIDQLSTMVYELNGNNLSGQSGDFLSNIEKIKDKMDTTIRQELDFLVNELKTEIAECNRYIIINSRIVVTNIQQLKVTFDKILACKPAMDCVYDHTGNTVK